MSKQTPFFKFDAMQWLGGAIQNCTLEEKGLFIDLCALYWKDYKPVKMDAKFKVRYRNLEGTLSNLIGTLSDLDFIVVSEAEITIPFLDALMNDRQEFLEKCSKAGKKSASIQGTSSNKKEERRKKKEESRDKKEDKRPAGAAAHDCAISSIVFPDCYNDEMKELFMDWASGRRDSKKYLTERAIRAHFKQLDGVNESVIASAYVDAIAGGWQSVHPKTDNKPKEVDHFAGLFDFKKEKK